MFPAIDIENDNGNENDNDNDNENDNKKYLIYDYDDYSKYFKIINNLLPFFWRNVYFFWLTCFFFFF